MVRESLFYLPFFSETDPWLDFYADLGGHKKVTEPEDIPILKMEDENYTKTDPHRYEYVDENGEKEVYHTGFIPPEEGEFGFDLKKTKTHRRRKLLRKRLFRKIP